MAIHAIEWWVRIFDDVGGVEGFELYQDSGVQKKRKAHDDEVADDNEAEEVFREGVLDVLGPAAAQNNAITKADVGYVGQQKSDTLEKDKKSKRQ